jgi:hypothetical protein
MTATLTDRCRVCGHEAGHHNEARLTGQGIRLPCQVPDCGCGDYDPDEETPR